ncbi:class I SAM-dependent methyltransferase [Allostreptomyces psammosilenae]|uniref:O-methyltransferase involved in polyketide biosynthesis n=1 Tax=Allostreptomyces psammosilenae TaxID=1892865 RepID=A0A853A065_9ACTN|nr:class I SAM-dependent methyltransferase [Allostreptomyces psammosilenae]NYI03912.1 O-methyltransferase involved in polyketide biosynthesis [Allostreptomyces psammosilenae]
MDAERVRLTGTKETLLATLHARALDAESASPVLGDTMAAETVRRIDYDFRRTRVTPGNAPGVAMRARQLDAWTAEFLAAHPQATVLHLGCGLDTRVYRLDPGPGVRWYDVDYPEVMELRRRLYPSRAGYTMIPSSVTDPEWLSGVPADRPVLVVAEGLTMYLTAEDGIRLVRRLVDHFPGGELAFDVISRFGIRLQRLNATLRSAGATLHWGVDDPRELERVSPRLRCVAALSVFTLPGGERLPLGHRALLRVVGLLPGGRRMMRLLRYRF